MKALTFNQFREDVLNNASKRPAHIRFGQAVFNYIDSKYNIARKVQFEHNTDCFFDDSKADAFIKTSYDMYVELCKSTHIGKLIVLQGPPACGKSTYARDYIRNHNRSVIVSHDGIRQSMVDYCVPVSDKIIEEVERAMIVSSLNDGLTVIEDSTNLSDERAAMMRDIASECNADIEFIDLVIPMNEAIKRDADENRVHHVGAKTIEYVYKKYYNDLYSDAYTMHRDYDDDIYTEECIICDLDGTLALHQGRHPFDWSQLMEDKCDTKVRDIIKTLSETRNAHIIFLTGRPEVARENTERWLRENGFTEYTLIMRDKDDFRHGDDYKRCMYNEHIKPMNKRVLCVLEDSEKCVKMWREEGLLTLDVASADY